MTTPSDAAPVVASTRTAAKQQQRTRIRTSTMLVPLLGEAQAAAIHTTHTIPMCSCRTASPFGRSPLLRTAWVTPMDRNLHRTRIPRRRIMAPNTAWTDIPRTYTRTPLIVLMTATNGTGMGMPKGRTSITGAIGGTGLTDGEDG